MIEWVILTTANVSSIAAATATSGGNVTVDGGGSITNRGVCWSTTTGPSITNSKTSDGSGTGNFVSLITGLTAGVKYYVRAYSTNSAGTSDGNFPTALMRKRIFFVNTPATLLRGSLFYIFNLYC